jgi:hypothetical protein
MPLKVIGAGYPRTGTYSLKLALEQLGFGPCHHMAEILQHPEQATLWARAFSGDPIDWDEVLAGYNSSTDAPSCFMAVELADRYPDAKVILGIRSAESWWESAQATIMSDANRERMSRAPSASLIEPMMLAMRKRLGADNEGPSLDPQRPARESAMAAFDRHNERISSTIPAERLLIFEAGQGWGPLCEFLGVPVPDAPYPKTNTRGEFHELVTRVQGGADTAE